MFDRTRHENDKSEGNCQVDKDKGNKKTMVGNSSVCLKTNNFVTNGFNAVTSLILWRLDRVQNGREYVEGERPPSARSMSHACDVTFSKSALDWVRGSWNLPNDSVFYISSSLPASSC